MSHTDTPGFRDRYFYVVWLRSRGLAAYPTRKDIALGANVGYSWLQKREGRDDASNDRTLTRSLCSYLGVSEDWLLDGKGEPPDAGLWGVWWGARLARKEQNAHDDPNLRGEPRKTPQFKRASPQQGKERKGSHKKQRRTG